MQSNHKPFEAIFQKPLQGVQGLKRMFMQTQVLHYPWRYGGVLYELG